LTNPPPHKSSDQPTPPSRHAKPLTVRGAPNPLAVRGGLGRHVFGLGIFALGFAFLVWGDFLAGQAVPIDFPHHTALAYTVAAFLLVIGAALQNRSFAAWAAAALTTYYTLVVVILMNGPGLVAHYAVYGTYEGLTEQLAIAAAALIVYSSSAKIDAALATRLTHIGQLVFAFCALIWGGAHFIYMNLTAPLIPRWLPPSQVFWGYLTGVAFLAAGLAILTRIQARLAAILLTAMLAIFTLLVHIRILLTDHRTQFNWTELALNVTLLGAAWIVADSFAPQNP
jgi:hypothetical protein